MSAKSSVATDMAWNWVIQSLAKFKQVDSSTSLGLVKKAPAISDDMGKDAREMVALRVLEDLFINANDDAVDFDSATNAKVSFDLSDNCEDVLHRILGEASEPMTESVKQNWNVRPFILHKRSSLPKSPLQKFKEAILEDDHPLPTSLKEMSRLGGHHLSEVTIPNDKISVNDHTTVVEDDLTSPSPANENENFQESPLQKSDHVENSIEHEVSDPGETSIEHEASDHVEKSIEREVSIEPSVKGLEEDTLMDLVEQANDDNVHQGAYRKGRDKRVQINMQPNDGNQVETCSDREGSEDERTDIAARKEAFFSSQGTLSQDFMATIDCSELCICMKCNKGGELLICSSYACPFRVHESCLGSAATFDDNGNFFCPFCAYSHAISEYLEGKKKASLARKQLQAFLSSGVKRRPNISSKKDVSLDKKEPPQRAPDENIKVNNNRGKTYCAPEASTSSCHHVRCQPIKKPILQEKDKGTLVPSVSGHSKRRRKSDPQYASPSLTLARRKNLQWTKLEEDTLKEAMQKFSTDNDKKKPWKDILDFGRDVFDKRRTSIDLKDKWRNLCKEKPSTKKQKL